MLMGISSNGSVIVNHQLMTTSVRYRHVATFLASGAITTETEEKENIGCQIAAKKALLGDCSFVQEFEMGCTLSTVMKLENTVTIKLFLPPGFVLWKTMVI